MHKARQKVETNFGRGVARSKTNQTDMQMKKNIMKLLINYYLVIQIPLCLYGSYAVVGGGLCTEAFGLGEDLKRYETYYIVTSNRVDAGIRR